MMITADAEMSSVLGKDISLKNLMVTHRKMNEAITNPYSLVRPPHKGIRANT